MSEVELITDPAELRALKHDWHRLLATTDYDYPNIDEVEDQMNRPGASICVAVVRNGGSLSGLASFRNAATSRAFTIGERKLFALPVRATSKTGFVGLGTIETDQWAELLQAVMNLWRFTLVDLGEVPTQSTLQQATKCLPQGLIVARGRKPSIRWFIDLPKTFDEYLNGLRSSTRKKALYALRRFEREQSYRFVRVTRPDQVEQFLRDGETISRRTYQWDLGARLENSEFLRTHYRRLAEAGSLRCHLLYIDGIPAGFTRSELHAGICRYDTPGFDRRFEKLSPGLVMLLWAIRDLIENTECRLFDFGEGGDDQGYKSRFGNRSITCNYVHIYRATSPYSLFVYSAERALALTKTAADAIIGNSALRQRLKKAIRKYGVDEPQG